MRKDLYNFDDLFKEITSIFDSKFNDVNGDGKYNSVFKTIKGQYSEIDESFESNCNKALAYLEYLEEEHLGEIDTAKGSIYLYSWLCDVEFNNSKYNKKGLDIYKKLLEKYDLIERSSNIPNIFGNYLKDNIDDNLKNLYDLYYKFDKFKHNIPCTDDKCNCVKECYNSYKSYIEKCNNYDNVDFCNGLKEFRAQYNNYMSKSIKCNGDYKYLPSAINSDISVILIPTIATLIIISILFVLYKFTPLGSWMCPRSKNKYKIKNNIGEQMYDTIHRSGINNNSLIKNPYTIAYHSMEHS